MSTVLVLTNSHDKSHVSAVASHLRAMGHETVRVDVDAMLRGEQSITWDYQSGRILWASGDGTRNLLDVESVWFRKPFGYGSATGFAESIQDPVQRSMVEMEVRDVIEGLAQALGAKRWVNHPMHINIARLKPYQLYLARSLGIDVPDTIITNDPDEARSFCNGREVVFKALARQELDYGDVLGSIDTTMITARHLEQLHLIRSQPILLQRHVRKSGEIRATFVGDEVFVAKQSVIDDGGAVDWRPLQDASTYEPWALPPRLLSRVQTLLKALELKFAAVDFALDDEGTPWFLELNPNGQWLGYTDEIGLPAASSMARLLVT